MEGEKNVRWYRSAKWKTIARFLFHNLVQVMQTGLQIASYLEESSRKSSLDCKMDTLSMSNMKQVGAPTVPSAVI
jgi:hypothetical protein